jgi:hypothetical protein
MLRLAPAFRGAAGIFFALADLGQIGFRPLSACTGGRAAGVLTADGGPRAAFVNDFNEVGRHWRHTQGRPTRRPPRMPSASAVGTALRPEASLLGPHPSTTTSRNGALSPGTRTPDHPSRQAGETQ